MREIPPPSYVQVVWQPVRTYPGTTTNTTQSRVTLEVVTSARCARRSPLSRRHHVQSRTSEVTSKSVRTKQARTIQSVIELTARHDRLVCARFAPAQLPSLASICAISDASLACMGLTSALAPPPKRARLADHAIDVRDYAGSSGV
jgi:hypothetical protein